jgi:hypothetical protein
MTSELQARFNRIMVRVDEWAEDNTGWDCRDDAVAEVNFLLNSDEYKTMSDDEIFDDACQAWLMAE